MLPGDRTDERNKNGSSPPQTDFEEVDEDLVEIMRSYEKRNQKEEVLEVRVLVVKPGNKQQLLTCEVPLHCDERDILLKVLKLYGDRRYCVNMHSMKEPSFEFDYIIEFYENDNGKDLDRIINYNYMRENCLIPVCEGSGALDDEVVELTGNEASHVPDSDEIEEIRADDEVLIDKVIIKHDLIDHAMEEATGTADNECEEMEVDQTQIKDEDKRMEEDVIPLGTYVAHIDEDNEIQEIPPPTIENFPSDSEEVEEIEEIRPTIERRNTEFINESIEEYFSNINEGVKEIVDVLDVTQTEELESKVEEDKQFDKEVRETESEKDMEEDKPSFEEVTDNESGKEMEEGQAAFEEVGENESEKEMEEGAKETEEDVETVCIADDTLDDDGNENSSQTSGDKTILFIYPMSRGGITMTRDDYECLSEGQYLNDIIIDFYLNYQMQEVLSPEDRERTHLFSSHFYTRLTKLTADEDSQNLSLDERRYAGVQRWTKDVNIFEKDFIIVPINENCHWFLAIICFPNLVDFVGYRDFDCEIKGVESQKPCILIFDSLGVTKKTRVALTLRGYLRHEYMAKMNEDKNFTYVNLKTVYPKAPCQQNATDCGLYVLQYVESFFKDPLLDFTLPLKDLSDWFPRTVIEKKRERIAKLIARLAIKYNKGKAVHLPLLKLPKPKLPEALEKASSRLLSKRGETSAQTEAKFRPKKKSPRKRIDVGKRLKKLCDSDSDSDATVPATTTSRSRLRVSSHNPLPLRRSAYVARSQMPKFFSDDDDDSDNSPSSTKTASAVPSSFLKDGAGSQCSTSRNAFRTYQGPLAKSWGNFCDLTGSNNQKEKPVVSNTWTDFSELTGSKKEKEKQVVSNNRETTRSILKSGGISTDRFYSLDALFSTPGIPPEVSFSKYKIKKKNVDNEI